MLRKNNFLIKLNNFNLNNHCNEANLENLENLETDGYKFIMVYLHFTYTSNHNEKK